MRYLRVIVMSVVPTWKTNRLIGDDQPIKSQYRARRRHGESDGALGQRVLNRHVGRTGYRYSDIISVTVEPWVDGARE